MDEAQRRRLNLMDRINMASGWPISLAETPLGPSGDNAPYEQAVGQHLTNQFNELGLNEEKDPQSIKELIEMRIKLDAPPNLQGPKERAPKYNRFGTPELKGGNDIAALMEILRNIS